MKKAMIAVIALSIFFSFNLANANDLPLLFPTDSDKKNEKIIGKYLEEVKGWKVTYKFFKGNEDDILLQLAFNLKDLPVIRITVDCTITDRLKTTKEVTGNRVKLSSYYKLGIKNAHPKRYKILEVLNTHLARTIWPKKAFLDKDGDLLMVANIYIAEKDVPTHAGQVAGEIERMVSGWKDLYKKLSAAGIKF